MKEESWTEMERFICLKVHLFDDEVSRIPVGDKISVSFVSPSGYIGGIAEILSISKSSENQDKNEST